MAKTDLPAELRSLVRAVTDLWGQTLKAEGSLKLYRLVEDLRQDLKSFRSHSAAEAEGRRLLKLFDRLEKLSRKDLQDVTHAFAGLLLLINQCENAFRSHRLRAKPDAALPGNEIYLILTAHPTESRSPAVVDVLQAIQMAIGDSLSQNRPELLEGLVPLFLKLWHLPLARSENPQVKDEAEYIYSILFRELVLKTLSEQKTPVFIRTWVGGDKDGHPGVDEKVMLQSLQLSRQHILSWVEIYLSDYAKELSIFTETNRSLNRKDLQKNIQAIDLLRAQLGTLRKLQAGDAAKVARFQKSFQSLKKSLSPSFEKLIQFDKMDSLLRIFPSLVVPLELRESSDVFREHLKKVSGKKTSPRQDPAIFRMLKTLKTFCSNSDPRGYARGLIVSMTQSFEDLCAAEVFLTLTFGSKYQLPLIPLFEQSADLKNGPDIMTHWIRHRKTNKVEIMLGYSDSSKEAGVLASRLEIRQALKKFEDLKKTFPKLMITYFHGSGGSEARGGGSLEDQTAHWPQEAMDRYKATIQGEMIQRTFSTPEILNQFLEKIATLSRQKRAKKSLKDSEVLTNFSNRVSTKYRQTIADPEFLSMVETASAYKFLEELHFGSRPSKRKKLEGVNSLRAIPWILAWTQTRTFFPTWWGLGSAFQDLTKAEKAEIQRLGRGGDVLFSSFIKLIGFTLEKIELPVWRLYLEKSSLTANQKKNFYELFENELRLTEKAFREITGETNFLWFRPWLKESIRLRTPLVHPLHAAQLIAWHRKDAGLLQEASVGIASGLLTTG